MYKTVPTHLAVPISSTAFSSAWKQKHFSRSFPYDVLLLHLSQPPSKQFTFPRGVPLYPVEIIRLSLAITTPTARFIQLLLVFTIYAIFIKYWSQFGRTGLRTRSNCIRIFIIRSFILSPSFFI